jgi:hypothetical protein
MLSGKNPSTKISFKTLNANTVVFPVPGPATINTGGLGKAETELFCSGFNHLLEKLDTAVWTHF